MDVGASPRGTPKLEPAEAGSNCPREAYPTAVHSRTSCTHIPCTAGPSVTVGTVGWFEITADYACATFGPSKRLPADARDHLGRDMVPYGGLDAPPLPAGSTAPARRSGWCTFEESVSTLGTNAGGSL